MKGQACSSEINSELKILKNLKKKMKILERPLKHPLKVLLRE